MSFDRRITPARADLADERLRGAVEAPRYSTGKLMRVAAPSTPLRPHPSPEVSIDTEALMGERVRVYDEHEGWAWGQLENDGYVGYLSAEALGPEDPAPTHRVAALRSFVYPGPDLKLPPLQHLSLGAAVPVIGREKEWARIGRTAFIFAGHLGAAARGSRLLEGPYGRDARRDAPPACQRAPHGGRDRAVARSRGTHPAQQLRPDRRSEAPAELARIIEGDPEKWGPVRTPYEIFLTSRG